MFAPRSGPTFVVMSPSVHPFAVCRCPHLGFGLAEISAVASLSRCCTLQFGRSCFSSVFRFCDPLPFI